jgi:hypothetical protein
MNTRKASLLRQVLMAATLAVGFGILWCILSLWLGTTIYEAWSGKLPPWENVVVMSDGTPLIVTYSSDNLSLATYRDLNSQKHDPENPQEQLRPVSMPGVHEPPDFFSSQLGWDRRIKAFTDEREPTANWYFVHDGKPQGAGYFVGYERISNRLIGYIGLSGSRPRTPPTEEWIPVRAALMVNLTPWSSAPFYNLSRHGWQLKPNRWDVPPRLVHVPSGNQLRLADLNARTVSTVFEAPEPIESVGVPTLSSATNDHRTQEQPIQVRTRQKIYTLDQKHKIIRDFDIPAEEIGPQSPVSWYELGDGRAIAEFARPWPSGNFQDRYHRIVYRIAANGSVQERFELTLNSGNRAQSEQTGMTFFALGIPSPAMVLGIEPVAMMMSAAKPSYPQAVNMVIRNSWPAIVAVLAASSVLAWLAWRRGHEFGLDRRDRVAWAVFMLLAGIPGYAGFLLARRWPVREPCPICHANVPRDRDACAECGTPFPEPALRGIEIFA